MSWNRLAEALILAVLAVLVIQTVQSKEEPPELKGNIIKIQDIIQNEAAYDGKMVVIEGKIVDECGSGCWFIVDDGTASIYVDILPSNFVIPQKRGSNAKVYGSVTAKDGDLMIIGKIVEVGGEIHR
ncbi:MAG: hypothetical protein ACE14P_02425 [Methanotrichaceae archaeon]